ncbi:MAG: polysaccharide biosynthesis tyrosine autokinase [Tepidisphaeraceae bacterium]|jgi:capsular exopolysaccharide synthesis family protein
MTTLPLNQPIRLPGRQAGSVSVAIPGSGPIGPLAAAQSAAPLTGADIWRIIRSNLWLIIIMVIISGVAGYGVNQWLKMYHSRYTATGELTVVEPISLDPAAARYEDPNVLNINLNTHRTNLINPVLFDKVLEDPNSDIHNSVWYRIFRSDQDALQDLEDNFVVAVIPDTRLLAVSMTGSDPQSCQDIVKSITDEYIKEQQELNANQDAQRNSELEQRKVIEENEVKRINGSIEDLEAQLNANGVMGTMNRLSQKDVELSSLLDNIVVLEAKRDDAEDDYVTLQSEINSNPTQNPPKIDSAVESDPEVIAARQERDEIQMALASQVNEGAASLTMTSLQTRSDEAEKKYEDTRAKASVKWREYYLEDAKEAYSKAARLVDAQNKQVDNLKSDMSQLTELMHQLIENQDEKTYAEAKLKTISDQLEQVEASTAKGDFAGVEWRYMPPKPDSPSFPKLPVTMILAITFGLALALGIAFLREMMDTTIRSPRDINRVGNLNLLGIIPHEDDDRQSAGARLPVVIFEAPHSMMAEQLRQVRTRLQHSSSLDTTRTILITSPSPGDGKTTIACNLASGLALNGRRILLVDANFRRPELHRVFNLPNEQGFSDVLNNLEMFEHAVQETQVPNLYILPSGPKPTNATELLESQLLMDFIERALEEYDHVMFDSGPLLFVSETVALAPRVDGVVTVVRARTSSRGVLMRLRETLRQVKAEHLGVVLNAVRSQGGGYYGANIRTHYQYQNTGNAA